MKKNIPGLTIIIVGAVGVIVLIIYIFSNMSLPAINSGIATSTGNFFENIEKIAREFSSTTVQQTEVQESSNQKYSTMIIMAPKGNILADIANNPTKRELGLSYRTALRKNTGMILIYPKPTQIGIWMKDMNFPIDVVWISPQREVLGVLENISPDSYPQTFMSPPDSQFALELNAGQAKSLGIITGLLLKF